MSPCGMHIVITVAASVNGVSGLTHSSRRCFVSRNCRCREEPVRVEFIATRLQEKSFGVLPRCLWPQKRCGDFQIGTGLAQLSDSRVRHLRAVEVQGYQALEFSKFFQPRVRYLRIAEVQAL